MSFDVGNKKLSMISMTSIEVISSRRRKRCGDDDGHHGCTYVCSHEIKDESPIWPPVASGFAVSQFVEKLEEKSCMRATYILCRLCT